MIKSTRKYCLYCIFNNACTAITLWLPVILMIVAFLVVNIPHGVKLESANKSKDTTQLMYNNNNDDIFHYIHVSDIHLSNLVHTVYERFDVFLNRSVPMVRPSFVIQSGDITHAKDSNALPPGSDQKLHEWVKYKELLQKYGMFNPQFWIDLRGNHDNMGVRSLSDSSNYFQKYGVMGTFINDTHNERVYSFTHESPSGKKYSFLFMDISEAPGLNYPIDVFPLISFRSQNIKTQLLANLKELKSSEQIVLVGHYPISTFYNRREFYDLIRCVPEAKVSTYLTGHYHLRNMYNRFSSGLLELEVADFKYKSVFRVMAVDNGVMSFTDTDIDNDKPLVLITNPKDAKFLTQYDNWEMMALSSHVRVLVFSQQPITTVQLLIDNEEPVMMQKSDLQKNGQLFVYPWEAQKYNNGKYHEIRVIATDESGKQGQAYHKFSLDGSAKSAHTRLYMNYAQRANHTKLIMLMFAIPYLFGVVVLLLMPKAVYIMFRYKQDAYELMQYKIEDHIQSLDDDSDQFIEMNDPYVSSGIEIQQRKPSTDLLSRAKRLLSPLAKAIYMGIYMHIWRYMHIPWISWSLLMFVAINFLVAPLFIAPVLMKKYWGVFFIWGIVVDKSYLPKRGDSFAVGILLTVLIWLPCVVLSGIPNSARAIYYRQKKDENDEDAAGVKRILRKTWQLVKILSGSGIICVAVLVLSSLYGLFFMAKLYGILSVIASSWTIILGLLSVFAAIWSFIHVREIGNRR